MRVGCARGRMRRVSARRLVSRRSQHRLGVDLKTEWNFPGDALNISWVWYGGTAVVASVLLTCRVPLPTRFESAATRTGKASKFRFAGFDRDVAREGRGSPAWGTNVHFLFSDHMLDTDRRELHRGSEPIAVEPQVLDLLIYLVQNRERVVRKRNLIA